MNESLYNRDPQDTELGKRILKHSILMINELGFEEFNFKKLATEISSSEKSIYRYFSNKHLLLLFLTSWYWEWVHYLITTNIRNLENPEKRLEVAIKYIVLATSENSMNEYINENILHRVIINEGSKSYHTSLVDEEEKVGLFSSYKSVVACVSELISEVNPEFPYALSLSSSLFETANNQIFFAEHLPGLTSIDASKSVEESLISMLDKFAKSIIR